MEFLDCNDNWTNLVHCIGNQPYDKPTDEILDKRNSRHTEKLFVAFLRKKDYKALEVLKPYVHPRYHTLIQNSEVVDIAQNSKPNSSISELSSDIDRILANTDITSITYKELKQYTNCWNKSNLIGHGSFAKVYRASWINTPIAIKRLKRDQELYGSINKFEKFASKEFQFLNRFRHPNILSLLAYSNDGPTLCLISEYMVNESLYNQLHCRNDGKALSWSTRAKIAIGTATGLQFLHQMEPPLIHGDIKSMNILLNEYFVAKICDFGLVQEGPEKQLPYIQGTHSYLPEDFLFTKKLSIKTDVYSFGVVLFELSTGLKANYSANMKLSDYINIYKSSNRDQSYLLTLMDQKAGHKDNCYFLPLINLGFECTGKEAQSRPHMVQVYKKLVILKDNVKSQKSMEMMISTKQQMNEAVNVPLLTAQKWNYSFKDNANCSSVEELKNTGGHFNKTKCPKNILIQPEIGFKILTYQDVYQTQRNQSPKIYDAFILYANADKHFAKKILDRMELDFHLEICDKNRNLLNELCSEKNTIMKLISRRCRHVLAILSQEFMKNENHIFHLNYANATKWKSGKVITCIYNQDSIPLEYVGNRCVDYRTFGEADFWKKLRNELS